MIFPTYTIQLPEWVNTCISESKTIYATNEERMELVLELAAQNIKHDGGPFGAAIFECQTGKLIAPGINLVMQTNCSVVHAEIVAIIIAQQMVSSFEYNRCSVLGVEEVPQEDTGKYGIVEADTINEGLHRITSIVEKPDPETAPSNLAVVGRYILMSRIFDLLELILRGAGGEIQLTDAIAALLKEEQVLAYQFKGHRYDCGSKLGYLKATIEYALKHDELSEEFRQYLRDRFGKNGDKIERLVRRA